MYSCILQILHSVHNTNTLYNDIYIVQGTLIQHLKELVLQSDLCRDDVLFYYTTTGWMMWNWLVSGLAAGLCVQSVDVCTCTGCKCVHVYLQGVNVYWARATMYLCTCILALYIVICVAPDVYLLFIQLMWMSRRCLYLFYISVMCVEQIKAHYASGYSSNNMKIYEYLITKYLSPQVPQ